MGRCWREEAHCWNGCGSERSVAPPGVLVLDSLGITRERFQLRNHSVGRRTGSVSRINRKLAPRGLPTIEERSTRACASKSSRRIRASASTLAHDRSQTAVDDESHWSFPATAKGSWQRGRRRDHSIHVERHPIVYSL